MTVLIQLGLLIIGFIMLVKGADWFVDGASGIAEKFKIPQLVIGLTIVAMGTSAPEAAVSITAALKGSADITVGNVVGSNIMNVLVILGLASVITTIRVAKSTIRYELPFMLLITLVFMGLGFTGEVITLSEGIILLAFFIAYLAYMFYMAKTGQAEAEEIDVQGSIPKLLFMTLIGLALVVFGSDVTVDAATELATFFGVSKRFIGLTIVALGTSLPELCTSCVAAKKGKADIAIGNIVGSNIFNILFVVGLSALVTPVAFASSFVIDSLIAFGAGAILWLLVFKKQSLNRTGGLIMLACYVAYFIYLL